MMLGHGGDYSRFIRGVFAWLLPASILLMGADAAALPAVQTLTAARFVASAQPTPPADEGVAITLPDAWEVSRPRESGYGWYLIDWTLSSPPAVTQALYLTATTLQAEVFVNGATLGSTGALDGPRPRGVDQAHAFVLPSSLLHAGANRIAIRVYSPNAGEGGFGPITAGPAAEIHDQAYADLLKYVVGPAIVSATIVVLGLIIVVLWLRRRDPAYALFGFAAVIWGLHTAASMLPAPLLPQPHWTIWWHVVYIAFVGMLCLFCLLFAGATWLLYRRFVIAFTVATAPALYIASYFNVLGQATLYARAVAIGLVVIALAAVARYAIRIRNAESVLLFATGAISTAFGMHDWILSRNPLEIRPLWLVPYAALSFLMLVAWILVDRFVRALNEAERVNVDLERRVAEKSAALTVQLAETRAARDSAEIANRAKSRFLAAASHDLRQPLHALGLFVGALAERVNDVESAALVHKVNNSVSALEILFAALLDISKLDAGAIEPKVQPTPLDPLFDRIVNDFAPEALERGLKLAVVPTTEVVQSDSVLLERIVRNLVANALNHTQRGGVVVGCRRRGQHIGIEVWDSGPGIARSEQQRIFEEFYQIGNKERDRSRGLGLGLAIVRRLADLLGHEIEVRSQPGRGSVFGVWARRAVDLAPIERHSPADAALTPLQRRRVMVVDDEAPIREGMETLLRSWGCVALVAADTAGAISIAGAHERPDALLVDYRLREGMDGLRAIALLREALGGDIPAILISGESSVEELARIKRSGLLLLHKPVMPAKLRSALAFVLAQEGEERVPGGDSA
jgi:signal transduction histidine kinase/CheY-like chemotaxis protein